jgi:hypothetical protein
VSIRKGNVLGRPRRFKEKSRLPLGSLAFHISSVTHELLAPGS